MALRVSLVTLIAHEVIMTGKARECVFCRNHRKLTDEHVLPDWLSQIIAKGPTDGNIFTRTDPLSGASKSEIRQGHLITRKVRVVCGRCNSGWLSDLEEELKPTLIKLIKGEALTLDDWLQRRLATWAVKTAMTAEYLEPSEAALKFDLCEYLRLHRQPHQDFDVYIGSCAAHLSLCGWTHHSAEMFRKTAGENPTGTRNSMIALLGLGKMIIEIGYCGVAGVRFGYEGKTTEFLKRIWPLLGNVIAWPPASLLDARGVSDIENGMQDPFRLTSVTGANTTRP